MDFLRTRREKLRNLLKGKTALFFSGKTQYRNITASGYPFRPNSHSTFFFGPLPANTVALVGPDFETVYWPFPSVEEVVWDGPSPTIEAIKKQTSCADVQGIAAVGEAIKKLGARNVLSVPALQLESKQELQRLLGRDIQFDAPDLVLVEAIVKIRLCHDGHSVSELRRAAEVTTEAYRAGRAATKIGATGWDVLAVMESSCLRRGMRTSFQPTVTTAGETLHCSEIVGAMKAGDLLLVDFGAETAFGYAADVTRTWPVSGKFSDEQREIYQLVLAMQQAAMEKIRPEVWWMDVHVAASRCLLEGLTDLGIVAGEIDSLLERGVHTLFFPHGIGHLIGLDVHDMEDFGDLAGYAAGKVRDERFGFNFLRLQRKLMPNMLVSNEPGFYWIPALLEDKVRLGRFADCFSLDKALRFGSVRGIRIEDEVLVTETGAEYLTKDIPKETKEVETS